jgi:hypothetical protein
MWDELNEKPDGADSAGSSVTRLAISGSPMTNSEQHPSEFGDFADGRRKQADSKAVWGGT